MPVDFNKLIPELSLWNDGKGADIDVWLSSIADFEHAIAYAELFWPEFIELDGCVFHHRVNEEYYRNWLNTCDGNKTSVETVINHVHILDCFPNAKKAPTREQIIHLGRKLKEIWQAKLTRDFPDKTIIVSFPEEDYEDLVDYMIVFFQPREEDLPPTKQEKGTLIRGNLSRV
jgi:hypothetical protein